MEELVRIRLENEMDLMLAHRRAMKLAELASLTLSAQTTFATAVSEVARATCDDGGCGTLALGVELKNNEHYVVARLTNELSEQKQQEGIAHASRLVHLCSVKRQGKESQVTLQYYFTPPSRVDVQKVDEWRRFFRNEPPLSPYEELKRRNEQLQELSERVQKSEGKYQTLTDTLPLIIFSLSEQGELVYANKWLNTFTGLSTEGLNRSRWKTVLHEDDHNAFEKLLDQVSSRNSGDARLQLRLLQQASGQYLWHQVLLTHVEGKENTKPYWIGYIVDIHAQKIVEETLKDNKELIETQQQLRENQYTLEQYIYELNRSNEELQQFAYVASHDLQEPVRKVMFYSDYLVNHYSDRIDEKGKSYLGLMQSAAQRMRALIHDILSLSQIDRARTKMDELDMNVVLAETLQDLEMAISEKGAQVHFGTLPPVWGDAGMMHQLFANIIGNSIKYARPGVAPVVTVRSHVSETETQLSFSDNGIGFQEKYLPQLFALFQRLQTGAQYEGTGIGLAICRKIMDVHGGRIWAQSTEGEGATFFVSFPSEKK
ncbi:MAG: PAS domain-containing sensor histidine kinase [Chitinophagaceae bacterium]|nr:MAG: PAS domain-containing sensor histidine kinase [Chitinophagaceae bacterium]